MANKTYKVRKGYVFYKGKQPIKEGEVIKLDDNEIKGQEWKLEEIRDKAVKSPPKDKAVKSPPKDK